MAVPWLTTPAQQLGAMEAGANVGLRRRAQNQGDLEAWQRLNLAYNELSAQNFRAAQAEKLRRDEATQALMLHQKQLDEQKRYHDEQIQQRTDAATALENYRTASLTKRGRGKTVHVIPGVGLVEYDADAGAAKVLTPTAYKDSPQRKLSAEDAIDAKDFDVQISEKNKEIAAATKELRTADEKSKPSKQAAVDALVSDKQKLLNVRKTIGRPAEFSPVMGKRAMMDQDSMGVAVPSVRVTTKEQFDALAPGALYIGEDGKTYRKP